MTRSRIVASLSILVLVLAGIPMSILAAPPATEPFERTWNRTDLAIADGQVSRTWMWGPEASTDLLQEPYSEAPDGQRGVQYFDKARMEDNSWQTTDAPWDVTNGLLVVELITGQMQVGDSDFESRSPAQVNVAGDADDPTGPAYASFGGVLDAAPLAAGSTITQRIDRDGQTSDDPGLSGQGVTVAVIDEVTNHAIAAPFWEFMGSAGMIYADGEFLTGPLFENRYFATGRPITEPYWANVKVAGNYTDVLLQCFERRCLTYTPGNDPAWQVEAGNVGQHYYTWRYSGPGPVEGGTDTLAAELAARLHSAPTDEARAAVLLEIMDYLHIGVYASDGQVIIRGAEQAWIDFYLYDFEIQMLAGAFGRDQTHSIADIAVGLESAGWVEEDATIDPALVAQAIQAGGAGALADQDALASRSALLVYELGLRHGQPVDIGQPHPWAELRLDPLQHMLLLNELLISAVADQLPASPDATSNLVELSSGVLTTSDRSLEGGICSFSTDVPKDAYGWGKIFAELAPLFPAALAQVTTALDFTHGVMLAYSVKVQELEQRVERHYGHGGPGETAQFRIKVEMLDELPDLLIECGWIVGSDYPAKGPIEGVSINWMWDGLDKHGQLECGAACVRVGSSGLAIDATGPDGIATLNFTPHEEAVYPCEGCWEVEETGIVTGIGLYQSRFTNLLGSNVQWAVPKSGATRWFVRWHEPPGHHVTMTMAWDRETAPTLVNDYSIMSGEVVIEFTVTGVNEANPALGPLARIDWTARGSGSHAVIDGPSDGGDVAGDQACSYEWSDEWSGQTVTGARRGENGEWILDGPMFEPSEVASNPPENPDGPSCADTYAGQWGDLRLGTRPEFPLVPGTYLFEEWRPGMSWEIVVELDLTQSQAG